MTDENKDNYLKSIDKNKNVFSDYYLKSFTKTEQQKFLELLLEPYKNLENLLIADVACGAGSLSFHLNNFFKSAQFYCSDYSETAIENLSHKLTGNNFKISRETIYELNSYPNNYFDFTFCWMTLSWLEDAEKALNQLIRITKPSGRVFLSSLFNLDHDVDLYTKIIDKSSSVGEQTIHANYYTYSGKTINEWIKDKVSSYKFHKFSPSIDFTFDGRGIGTYTITLEGGDRIQLSAGMLMNWAVLEIKK